MRYAEFLERNHFDKEHLLAFSHGNLVVDPPTHGLAQLPCPPFLMFDRITHLVRSDRNGVIVAEQEIKSDAWYFQCHFRNDPVQPGCLGLDAIWQLLGFYCVANGGQGTGRALGCGDIEFMGQIRPFDAVVRYELDVRRFTILEETGAAIAIANGKVFVDDIEVYKINKAKAGTFKGIAYHDYPNPQSPFAKGGLINHD